MVPGERAHADADATREVVPDLGLVVVLEPRAAMSSGFMYMTGMAALGAQHQPAGVVHGVDAPARVPAGESQRVVAALLAGCPCAPASSSPPSRYQSWSM